MEIVYITCSDKKEATKISEFLLDKGFVACTNIFPIDSLFIWKGGVKSSPEYGLLAKTKSGNFDKIEKAVKQVHSYELPCIISLDVQSSSKEYDDWVNKECK